VRKITARITLQKAHKYELPDILSMVLDIVKNHNPADLKIEGFYLILLAEYQQMILLDSKQPPHPYSVELKKLRRRRLKLIEAIVKQAIAVETVDIDSQREAALLILPIIKLHLFELKRAVLYKFHTSVMNFCTALKQSTELMAAAETIGIKVYANDLLKLEESMAEGAAEMNSSKSKRRIPALQKLSSRNDTINAFQNLIAAIELARISNLEIDYLPMIAELNNFLVPHQGEFKSRITRSKTASAKKTMTAAMSTTTSATAD